MLAGGIGYGKESQAQKEIPQPGDKVVILGGENYRIGRGVQPFPQLTQELSDQELN